MAFSGKPLADGRVSDSEQAIFQASANLSTYVKGVTFFNRSPAAVTVVVGLNFSGTIRRVKQFELTEQGWSADLIDEGEAIILEAGQYISAYATTGSVIDFTVMGVEEASA